MTWRDLQAEDRGALTTLIHRCHETDGGLPLPLCVQLTERRFAAGRCIGAYLGEELVAAAVIGAADDECSGAGMVLPAYRRGGLGSGLLAWTEEQAGERPVTIASEMLTEAAAHLYRRYGFVSLFEEAVMRRDLSSVPPVAEVPAGVELTPWSPQDIGQFYAAYTAAFADRPGFPGWTQDEWVKWTTGDEDFRADLSIVAVDSEERSLGFVTVGADWIAQLGVVPGARGQGVGNALTAAALRGIHRAGFRQCYLTVGTNNPHARRLYERSDFSPVGFRGKFRRP